MAEMIRGYDEDGNEFFLDPGAFDFPSQEEVSALLFTYKADMWRRSTPAEAEIIDAQIEAQPVRERNLFRDAQYLGHNDPFFAQLKAGFVLAFGQERADELLAPSL